MLSLSYRNGPRKNKNQLCNENLFLATGLGKKKSGTAGSCLKQVKIYLLERLLDRLPIGCIKSTRQAFKFFLKIF